MESAGVEKSGAVGSGDLGKQRRELPGFAVRPGEHGRGCAEHVDRRRADDENLRRLAAIDVEPGSFLNEPLHALRDIFRLEAEPPFEIVRSQHEDDEIERAVALETGPEIGEPREMAALDWIVIDGRSPGQTFGDDLPVVAQNPLKHIWPTMRRLAGVPPRRERPLQVFESP